MALALSDAARNAAADSVAGLVDGGTPPGLLRIYGGTQPASPDDTTAETVLAEVALADPAFGAAASGQVTLTDPAAVTGLADGTATWCRIVAGGTAAGGAGVLDGDVATSGALVNLNTTAISSGVSFDITGGSLTMPAS